MTHSIARALQPAANTNRNSFSAVRRTKIYDNGGGRNIRAYGKCASCGAKRRIEKFHGERNRYTRRLFVEGFRAGIVGGISEYRTRAFKYYLYSRHGSIPSKWFSSWLENNNEYARYTAVEQSVHYTRLKFAGRTDFDFYENYFDWRLQAFSCLRFCCPIRTGNARIRLKSVPTERVCSPTSY